MGIKRIKTRSQRITSFGYLKKIQNQRTDAGSGYFKKTSHNCRVSRKPGKEEPSRFLGGYFTYTIWDLGFRTSTDGQTGSGFQDLDKLTNWINGNSEKIAHCFTGLSLPHPPKLPSQTDRTK
jgi:hypothetical protein